MRLRQANEFFRDRQYAEALSLYQALVSEDPVWETLCALQIKICKSKITPADKLQEQLPSLIARTADAPKCDTATFDGAKSAVLAQETKKSQNQPETFLRVSDFADVIAKQTVSIDPANKKNPRVTVLMTSHNVIDYIEDAVYSLLFQTWKNIEIVVVDDQSSDGTYERLVALSKINGKLKVFRLNANLGTYFAKNYGLQKSTGQYIFFQDGDDISSRRRIEICMDRLLQTNAFAVRCCYSRATFPDGRVFPVDGVNFKMGLVTLGYRRDVFDRIGFFNCTTKASDDEFFSRFRSVYGNNAALDIKLPLYFCALRKGSLISDMIGDEFLAAGKITQSASPSRQNYVESYQSIHKKSSEQQLRERFAYPRIRDAVEVAQDMSKLANPPLLVIGNVCTFPARESSFKRMLSSVISQVDILNVYLDKYTTVPEWLTSQRNVRVLDKTKFPSMRDNGKFIELGNIKSPCFYFTFDDDIIYPPDYVNTMVGTIERYDRRVVVGCHGVVLETYPERYFSPRRLVYAFNRELSKPVLCHNLGTGTVAFYSGLCSEFRVQNKDPVGMVDILFSLYCKKHRIPMLSVPRHAGWLVEYNVGSPSLYDEFVNADDVQSDLVRENAPWGQGALPFEALPEDRRLEVYQRLLSAWDTL